MKQLFFLTILCLSLCSPVTFTAKAQTNTLDVDLTTVTCSVAVNIYFVGAAGTCSSPVGAGMSGWIWLAPGVVHSFDNTSAFPPLGLGGTAMTVTDYYHYIEFQTLDQFAPNCGTPSLSWTYDVCTAAGGGGPFDIEENIASPCNCTQTGLNFTWVGGATPKLTIF